MPAATALAKYDSRLAVTSRLLSGDERSQCSRRHLWMYCRQCEVSEIPTTPSILNKNKKMKKYHHHDTETPAIDDANAIPQRLHSSPREPDSCITFQIERCPAASSPIVVLPRNPSLPEPLSLTLPCPSFVRSPVVFSSFCSPVLACCYCC